MWESKERPRGVQARSPSTKSLEPQGLRGHQDELVALPPPTRTRSPALLFSSVPGPVSLANTPRPHLVNR